MHSTEDFLAHHGIKGQKWGVRRFQNEDRTRTPAGLLRESAERNTNKISSFFDDSKKAKIKKGAVIVAGVLATAAAGYVLHKSGVDKRIIDDVFKKTKNSSVSTNNSKLLGTKPVTKALPSSKNLTTKALPAAKKATSVVSNNGYRSMSSITGKPSDATRAILEANRKMKMSSLNSKKQSTISNPKTVRRAVQDRHRTPINRAYTVDDVTKKLITSTDDMIRSLR